jgi:hypothetical protein
MSKDKSPYEISFPFIAALSLSVGIPAFNSLISTTGDFFDTRNIFRDDRQPKSEQGQNPTTPKEEKITPKQFGDLLKIERSRHE